MDGKMASGLRPSGVYFVLFLDPIVKFGSTDERNIHSVRKNNEPIVF